MIDDGNYQRYNQRARPSRRSRAKRFGKRSIEPGHERPKNQLRHKSRKSGAKTAKEVYGEKNRASEYRTQACGFPVPSPPNKVARMADQRQQDLNYRRGGMI